jgi:putative ABC transport system permease protein
VLLAIGAGLLLRTFATLQRVDPGVDTEGVLAVAFALASEKYDSASARLQFMQQLETRSAGVPGASSVAISSNAPLTTGSYTSDFAVAGRAREDYGSEIAHRMVSPSYFATMRVPVLQGRAFTNADGPESPPVVIINQATADRHFKNENPVGQRITFDKYPDSTSTWRTIVGVVGNERGKGMAMEPVLESFVPLTQETPGYTNLLVRTDGDALSLAPGVRSLMQELDPDLAAQSVTTVERIRSESIARQRFLMLVLLMFAGVALLLAIVGVYGVTSQGARQRRQEIGVRLAMGAEPHQIMRLVVRQSAALIVLGVLTGSLAGLLASTGLTSLLFGVTAGDPVTYVAVAAVLLATGLIASWIPARAASRTDPAGVLRVE